MGCLGYFILGMFVGGNLGFLLATLCVAAAKRTPEIGDE